MPPRKSIPASQKASLRARKRLYPNTSQKELREWFKAEYNHTLSSGLISDIQLFFRILLNLRHILSKNLTLNIMWSVLDNLLCRI